MIGGSLDASAAAPRRRLVRGGGSPTPPYPRRLLGRAADARTSLLVAFPLAPDDDETQKALAGLDADFSLARDALLELRKGVARGRDQLRKAFGRPHERMKGVDLSRSKHGAFLLRWSSIDARGREVALYSVLKKVLLACEEAALRDKAAADDEYRTKLREELHVVVSAVGHADLLHPAAYREPQHVRRTEREIKHRVLVSSM